MLRHILTSSGSLPSYSHQDGSLYGLVPINLHCDAMSFILLQNGVADKHHLYLAFLLTLNAALDALCFFIDNPFLIEWDSSNTILPNFILFKFPEDNIL